MRSIVHFTIIFFFSTTLFAQTTIWKSVEKSDLNLVKPEERVIKPTDFDLIQIDPLALSQRLKNVDDRFSGNKGVIVDFPISSSNFETFEVFNSGSMEKELEIKYPNIRSYYGVSIENPLNKIYFTITPQGFRGLLRGAKIVHFDPYAKSTPNTLMIYDRNNLKSTDRENFTCGVTDMVSQSAMDQVEKNVAAKAFEDRFFRTYRIAIAATSEYTAYHNDNNAANGDARADALAAIVVTLARVNSVFEQEMSLRFTLVGTNDRIIYFNETNALGNTDPYNNYNGSQMLSANTGNLNTRIGIANYDIGHVFSTGGGGIAGTSPCDDGGAKGQGVTGIVTPEFDPFDIDYVCHEIGHQYGAAHTFYNGCFGGSPSSSPFETGSASTIMGYAGICAPNVQENSDAYFHLISLFQMQTSINGDTCESQISLGSNNPTAPSAIAPTNKTIPKSTPFKLTANSAIPADLGEIYTYNWDQLDTGTSANTGSPQPPQATNATGPMFRSKFATTNPTRYFPNIQDLADGVDPTWEELPSVARNMRFFSVIRDNNASGGQTSFASVTLTVGTAGPVIVTSPIANDIWHIGETKTVTWSVNGTNSATYATNVKISLSLDGGYTYPIVLLASTPNDGSQNIIVPDVPLTNGARVMVEAIDNYFFNISPANFQIKAGSFEINTASTTITTCKPTNATFTFAYNAAPSFSQVATFSAVNLPAGATATFSPISRTTDGNVTMTISGITNVNAGSFPIVLSTQTTAATVNTNLTFKVFDSNVGNVVVTAPVNGAANQAANPLLTWNDLESASSYKIDISEQSNFATIIETATVNNATSYQTTLLQPGKLYYWRITPSNGCTTGTVSSIQVFQTSQDVCITYDNEYFENFDFRWDINSTNAVSARVLVTDDIEITKVGFYMRATHASTGDLKMQFSSPTGRFSEVYNRECAAGKNFDVTINDTATQAFGCAPGFTGQLIGNFLPGQLFSRFNNTSSLGEWVLLATDRGANASGGTFDEFNVQICGRLQYVNDLSVTVNNLLSIDFNTSQNISNSLLTAQKSGTTATNTIYVITRLPKLGTIKRNGVDLILGSSFTQNDINLNRITYTHSSLNRVYLDAFDFVVRTASGNIVATQNTFNININKPTLIFNTNVWTPFDPSITTGDLNAQVVLGSPIVTTAVIVKDLTTNASQSLDIRNEFTITGNVINNGTLTATAPNSKVVLTSSQAQSISGSSPNFNVNLLEINNGVGVSVSSKVAVYDVLKLNNSILNANGNLVLKSTSTKTAQIDNATGSSISGNITVERFIPAKRTFRFLASSVNSIGSIFENWQENGTNAVGLGTHITGSVSGTNGFDATSTGSSSMFEFNTTTQAWTGISNTNVKKLNVGDGYRLFVRGDRNTDLSSNSAVASETVLRATGSPQIGDYTKTFSSSNGNFVLVANPYQANLDAKALLNETSSTGINANYAYIWDARINTRGAYATVDLSTTNGDAIPVSSEANKFIAPGQSFFLQTLGNASITFRERNKNIAAAQNRIFETPTLTAKVVIALVDNVNDELLDQTIINLDSNYNDMVDNFDATKFTNLDEGIYSIVSGQALAINRRSIPRVDETIDLGVTNYRRQEYSLQLQIENLNSQKVMLEDRYKNTLTTLVDGQNKYPFTIDNTPESKQANRFALKFTNETLTIGEENASGLSLYPNPSQSGRFTISGQKLKGETVEITVINTLGQKVHYQSQAVLELVQVAPRQSLAAGMYFVQITTPNFTETLRVIVE